MCPGSSPAHGAHSAHWEGIIERYNTPQGPQETASLPRRFSATGARRSGGRPFLDQRRGPMRVVLAEKPSVARELASFLGASSRHDGYLEGRGYQVTWALGHLAMLKEPEDYDPALRRWSLETLPIDRKSVV